MVRGTLLSLCVAGLTASAALAGTGEAEESAQGVVDLATITCEKFMENDSDTIGSIIFWLNGYYKNEDDPATIDFADMEERAKKLGAYCATNPTHGLITAADEILSD
jgi:acid stress chaperone HdeB